MRLMSKVVLITGSSKGIGRALAEGFAKEGADIVVNYRSGKEDAGKVVSNIKAMGRRAIAVQADVSKVSDIREMFSAVKREFGRIDVLINNAGITGWTDLFSLTEEQWDVVMSTNAKGAFFCAVEAAKMMKEIGGGSIINISTNCAALGVKNLVAYAASKGAIHAMTKQLACELAQFNIRVNTFAPGPTNVDRNLKDDPNYRDTWGSVVPLGRSAEPEEMVGPAMFLATDESSFVTGQVFFSDGGWSVQGKTPGDYWDRALANN